MKIKIVSDLHFEFDEKYNVAFEDLYSNNPDVIIIAGDTAPKQQITKWIRSNPKIPTIIIAGNHEFYGANWPSNTTKLQEYFKKYNNIHYLENQCITINGQTFCGSTLWTDFSTHVCGAFTAATQINDYKRITYTNQIRYRRFRTDDAINAFNKSSYFIKKEIEKDNNIVVITHFAPLLESVKYGHYSEFNDINAAYVGNMENVINTLQPKLWVHGHMHHSVDYYRGDTRIVSNPRGYFCNKTNTNENKKFDINLVIDI